jgi:hypothetical protein
MLDVFLFGFWFFGPSYPFFYDVSSFVSSFLLGNNAVVVTQPNLTPPARYSTALLFPSPAPLPLPGEEAYRLCAMSGLTMLNKRL